MRPVLGFIVAHLAIAAPGFALLWCTGMLRGGVRAWVLGTGPAYLLGVAMVAIVAQLLLVIGVAMSLALTMAIVLALCAAAVVARRRRGLPSPLPGAAPYRTKAERGLVALGGAMTILWFVFGARAFDQLPTQVDDARIWSLRTLGLFFHGGLQEDVFTGEAYVRSHLDYPLLVPVLDSTIYRFMGGEDLRLAHLELWICMAAFAWTVAWALAPGRRAVVWLPAVVVLPILGPVVDNIALGNVDTLVAAFSAAGALLVALWLEDGRSECAVLGAVLLGGAACTKNEGMIAALIVIAVAAVVLLVRRDPLPRLRRLRPWFAVAGIVLVAIVPWQLWLALHDVANTDVPGLGSALSPGYLSERTGRLGTAVERLFTVFGNQGVYLWIMPTFLALAVALVATARGRLRSLAGFYLAAVVLFFCALLWVFWTGRLDVQYHLDTAADRTSMTFMILALVGVAHLASSVVRAREQALAEPTDGAEAAPPEPPALAVSASGG